MPEFCLAEANAISANDDAEVFTSTSGATVGQLAISAETVAPPLPELNYLGTPLWKRSADVCGAMAIIIALSPLLLAVAIYIKCVSRGPVFFTQARCGAGGRKFKIYKFRTMHQCDKSEAEHRKYIESLTQADAPASKPKYNHRLIPGGEFLRGHSLDELPQLFNVLNGSMSLVGPRPEVLELHEYPTWQLRRFEVLPGMTGLWQVSGKNRLSFNRMIELDIEYIQRRSPFFDLAILLKTIKVVLHQDNA